MKHKPNTFKRRNGKHWVFITTYNLIVYLYTCYLCLYKNMLKYTPEHQDLPLEKCWFEDYFLSAFRELFREKPWNFGRRISQLNPSWCKSRGTFSFLQSSSMGAKYNRHLAWPSRVQAVRLQKSIERQKFNDAANWRSKATPVLGSQIWKHVDFLSEWLSPFLVTITHNNLHLAWESPFLPKKNRISLPWKNDAWKTQLMSLCIQIIPFQMAFGSSFGEVLLEPSPFPTRNPQNHLDGNIKPPGFK